MNNKGIILHELLDLGEAMLENGAEVLRVEDTLGRLGTAYGAVRTNAFVITSSIVVTMVFDDDQEITQTRRIIDSVGTDFKKLEELNELSRKCCENPLPVEELSCEIKKRLSNTSNPIKFHIGSVLAAGSLAVFFGGNLLDGLLASGFAFLICLMQRRLSPYCSNKSVFNLLCSFFTGISICPVARLSTLVHADKIMIGDIMLLIPGIALTNAIRDVLVGAPISGLLRLTESLLWACSLACGFMFAVWLIGV